MIRAEPDGASRVAFTQLRREFPLAARVVYFDPDGAPPLSRLAADRLDALHRARASEGEGVVADWSRRFGSARPDTAPWPRLTAYLARLPDGETLAERIERTTLIELLEEVGFAAVEQRLAETIAQLASALPYARFESDGRTIAIPFAPAGEARAALETAGLVVSVGEDALRLGVHPFTNGDDVAAAAELVSAYRAGALLRPREEPSGPLVCIDLNGVLDAYAGWRGAEHWDPPAPGARACLAALHARGARLVVFTTRHYRGVWRWLDQHDLAQYVSDVTDRKPAGDVFVDDRAIRFTGDYDALLKQLESTPPAHWESR